VKNPWQCLLTTDNPNGAPFVKYPEIIALLMSKRYRDAEFATIHQDTEKRVPLPAIERELNWYDIAVMTRAGQARALGITDLGKGHLFPGAEADIAIYPIRIDEIDPSAEYEQVIKGFSQTEYTIKRGRVVSRRGDAIIDGENTTFWVKPKVSAAYDMQHDPKFQELFERYYSIRMSNYPVQEEYLHRNHCIETETDL